MRRGADASRGSNDDPRPKVALVLMLGLSACAGAPSHATAAGAAETCASGARGGTMQSSMERAAVTIVEGIHGPRRDATYARFGDNFRAFLSLDGFHELAGSIDGKLGALVDTLALDEDAPDASGVRRIRVAAKFARGVRLYSLYLDQGAVLRGLRVEPLFPAANEEPGAGPSDGYVAKRAYGLPANGIWLVTNGGPSRKTNGHVGNPQQWYAFDFVQRGADGKTFTGTGKRNADYLAFGQSVIAPQDGTVVTVVDGVPDNLPGEMNGYVAPGNYIVLDHGDGEYSMLCHIETGSFEVARGAKVRLGDVLGRVGNSGNSSEPHIHWHLATAAAFEKGVGLPIRFGRLWVNGTPADSPSPIREDLIESLP